MTTLLARIHLLAQDDDSGWGRLIFPLIFALIWIISAIASAVNKKQQEQRRRERIAQQSRQAPPTTEPSRPAPPRVPQPSGQRPGPPRVPQPGRTQPPQRRQPAPTTRTPPPPMRPKAQPQRKPPARRQLPPVTAQQAEQALQVARQGVQRPDVTASEISGDIPGSLQRATPSAASAGSVAAWLRPDTLRRQFILTEILQPPVALRPPDERQIL